MPNPVQRGPSRDDPSGLPACFFWTVDEVADWVESIGYEKYKENFRSHFINGRRLLTIDACTLPKMGIVHYGDIMNVASFIKQVLGKGPHVPRLNLFENKQNCPTSQLCQPSDAQSLLSSWGDWLPEYYQGYKPKCSPITAPDFATRWWSYNCNYPKRPCPHPYSHLL